MDLLSEEGLFDASLIPLFGAMDSHREDVTDKEWVDLVLPEGTPNNFGTQLGLALMTDPLSFLTAPLNALGKGGRAAGQLSRSMGAALPEGATVGQALETGQTLLQGTTLAKGARRKLRNNLNTLRGSGHNKDILLDEASRFANKRNLAIAVPFLSRLGSWAPKGLEGYKNWWQVLRMGTDRSLALAAPFGGAATRLPLVGRAFKMVGTAAADAAFGAKAGAKTAGRALFKTQLDRALEPGTFDPILDRVTPSIMRIRKHLNRLTKRGKFDDLGQTFDERLGKQSELRKKLLGLEAEENADIIKALEERGAAKGKDPLGEAHLTLAADKTQLGRAKAKLANAKSRAKRLARKRNAADKAKYKKHKAAAARWEQLVKKKQAEVSEFSALLNPKQRQKVKAGVRRKISTAAKESHAKAFLRSLGMKTKRLSGEELQDEASRVWHSITGGEAGPLPIRGSELQAGVQKFQGDMTDSLTELFEGRTRMARTQAKELKQEALKRGGISRAFFKVFSEAEKLRTRTFLSGIQSKELIKQENLLWNSMARSTEAVQENYLALIARIPDAAREMGVSPDDFRSIMRNTLESSSFSKEITILTDLAHSSPEKFHASMEDFVTRAVSATDSLKTILRVRGGAEARQAGERVGELTRGVLDEGVTRAEFLEKLSDSVVPSRWKEYEWGAHPSHPTMFRARTGSASGLRLIHVSDTGLKGLMREGTRKEKTAAAKVLDLRAQGRSEWVKPEKVPAEQLPVPPRTPERIDSVDNLGEADELGEYTYVLAQLLSDTAELKRLKGAPPVVLIDRVNSNLARASGLLEDTVRAGMGETGQFILDETRRIQREIVVGAYNAGALSAGSPIAYVPRVFSAERAKEVQEILSDIPADILQAAAPSYGSTIHRSMGALTIEELEDLTIALRRREPEKAAELEELLSATGVNIKRYTDDPFEAIFTRYAQHGSHNTTKDFVNSIVKDGNTGLIGGRVVGVVSETGVNLDL
ncbi:MAG: hypothetical protein QF599_14285, partial [Planctomycetota bacterium]|nr:hypothetical protein [Planctomycetota bacterium]